MLSKKPVIFAAGCSFTDPNFRSMLDHLPDEQRGGWPAWPELLQKKIEDKTGTKYELVNKARSGGGNDHIHATVLEAIATYDERLKVIVIGGTQWMRNKLIVNDLDWNPQIVTTKQVSSERMGPKFSWIDDYNKSQMEMWSKWSTRFGITNLIYHNLRIMWSILEICKSKNIKVIWYQLLHPFPSYRFWKSIIDGAASFYNLSIEDDQIREDIFTEKFFTDTVLRSPYIKNIIKYKKQVMGLPWTHGKVWDDGVAYKEERKKEVILQSTMINDVRKQDLHPNRYGHEQIAKMIWEKYADYLVKN